MKYSHLKAIHEVYFGNSPELEAMISQVHIIRENAQNYAKNNTFAKFYVNFNTDPELLKLNRMFEEFFGFKTFGIYINEGYLGNAYTIPISSRLDTPIIRSKHIAKTSYGFKLKKDVGYSAMLGLNAELLINDIYTDREVLAIMFHEIGHNFASSVGYKSAINDLSFKVINALSIVSNTVFGYTNKYLYLAASSDMLMTEYNKLSEKIKRDHPDAIKVINAFYGTDAIFSAISDEIYTIIRVFNSVVNPIGTLCGNIIDNIISIARSPFKLLRLLFGREDELVADTFAGLYGLGPDLSSGLEKLKVNSNRKVKNALYKSSLIGTIVDICNIPNEFILSLFDEHPKIRARIYQQIKYAEQELERESLDPRLKKELQQIVKDCKEVLDKYNYPKNANGLVFSRAFGAVFTDITGGDIKDTFDHDHKKVFDDIEDLSNSVAIENRKNIFDKIKLK